MISPVAMITPTPNGLHLRPITESDLPAVERLGNGVHANHQERPEIFANRLGLFPDGCWMATMPTLGIAGYALAHAWPAGSTVPLDTVLLPPALPGVLYIHDVVTHPQARGLGLGAAFLDRLLAVAARHGLPALALTALDGLAPYWQRLGFTAVTDERLTAKLASYGPGACYMLRPLR